MSTPTGTSPSSDVSFLEKLFRYAFLLKLIAIVLGLFVFGLVVDTFGAPNSFTGIVVGMSWSLAFLLAASIVIIGGLSLARQALNR
ncbi:MULTISPECIES: hypothetical protein [unclassified Haladaptatus]|uniref:hypothetical protein n=1 Tax=unclassified Haladaptatus TaxID=2622732 RepID=UPI0023E8AC7C|nr:MULTISPECIES: hypothetical protein [unclassified Haladaptatus]